MNQLELKLQPKLSYSPENFVVHSGVRDILAFCLSEATQDRFSILFIPAAARSGKTHFSIRLSLEFSRRGFYPVIIEGDKFEEEAAQLEKRATVDHTSVFIIDDVQKYFMAPAREDFGAFVHFIEFLRVRKATVIVLSSLELDELPVDDHARSRLVPGICPRLEAPSEDEMMELLETMAKQRGVVIRDKKKKFLSRRLPRDIPSLERYLDRLLLISDGTGKALKFSLLGDAL